MTYLTPEGLKKIKEKLKYLKETKRWEIAGRLAKAKEFGDLSENAEYTTAKDDQALNEAEIARLENILKNAQVIEKSEDKNIVQVGSEVLININGEKRKYLIVGSSEEIDPLNGKISIESPLGQILIGKKIGEKGEIKTPTGFKEFKIIDIL